MKVFIFLLLAVNFGSVSIHSQAQTAQPIGHTTPVPNYIGKGYKDTCVGCLAHWSGKSDNRSNVEGTKALLAVRSECKLKGQCSGIVAYANAWTPLVLVYEVMTGPPVRWQKYREANKKAVCLYTESYFSGTEYCYLDAARFKLPEEISKKIGSFWSFNLKKLRFGVQNPHRLFFQWDEFDGNSEENDGYNLLPKYRDKYTHIEML